MGWQGTETQNSGVSGECGLCLVGGLIHGTECGQLVPRPFEALLILPDVKTAHDTES